MLGVPPWLGQGTPLLGCQVPSNPGNGERGTWAAGFQGKGEVLERALPLCSQTPGDHTKGWLQAYNGGAVSHCARAAGRQTEPPVSVPVSQGPIAPDPLPACFCLHPTLFPKLTLCYPPSTWQPSMAHPRRALVAIKLPWPSHTPSRSQVQTCKVSLASLGKTIGRASASVTSLSPDFHVRDPNAITGLPT